MLQRRYRAGGSLKQLGSARLQDEDARKVADAQGGAAGGRLGRAALRPVLHLTAAHQSVNSGQLARQGERIARRRATDGCHRRVNYESGSEGTRP